MVEIYFLLNLLQHISCAMKKKRYVFGSDFVCSFKSFSEILKLQLYDFEEK